MTHTEQIDLILNTARDAGYIPRYWNYAKRYFEMVSGDCTMRGHWNIHDNAWSVCTKIKHPKMGEQSMWRNYLTIQDVISVVLYAREHIGKQVRYESN
jgi:hypothetical protein